MLQQPEMRLGDVSHVDALEPGRAARQHLPDKRCHCAVGGAQLGIVGTDDGSGIGDLYRHVPPL